MAVFYLRLVPEEPKRPIQEVDNGRDNDKGKNVRQKSLQNTQARANYQQQKGLHVSNDICISKPRRGLKCG